MEKVFVISTVTIKNNIIETENAVYTDKENAKFSVPEFKKYMKKRNK